MGMFLLRKFKKSALTVTSLCMLALLASCGPNSRLTMNDQEAAVRATGTFEGKAIEINNDPVAVEDATPKGQSNASVSEPAPVIKVKFVDYEDVGIKINFDEKLVHVDFDLVLPFLPDQPKQRIVMEGAIQQDGEDKGLANLRVVPQKDASGKNKPAPPILAKARCLNECDSVVVDIITRSANGKSQLRQFEVPNGVRTGDQNKSLIEIKPEEAPVQTEPETTQPAPTVPAAAPSVSTPSSSTSTTSGSDKTDHDHEDEESETTLDNAVPGIAAPSFVSQEELDTLQPLESFVVGGLPSAQKSVAQQTAEQSAESHFPEATVYDSKNSKIPKNLGPAYTGKSKGFYNSYCLSGNRYVSARLSDKNGECQKIKASIFNGAIAEANELLAKILGVLSGNKNLYKQFGSGYLLKYLEEAGKLFAKKYPNESITVNEMSQQFGGPIWSTKTKGELKHKAHQNGLEADIQIVRKDNGLDIPKTWELIKMLYSLDGVNRIFLNQIRINEICAVAKSKKTADGKTEFETYNEALRSVQPEADHTTHLHLRLKCTAHNPSCRVDRTLFPKETACK